MSPANRGDFPMLRRVHDGRPIVYLDAAASTPSPLAVLAREQHCREELCANVHRGRHALSEEASLAYDRARARVARFINAAPQSIVFVRGTTEAINVVARGLGLSKDDIVLTTSAEHHSNLVPWLRQATVRFIDGPWHRPLDPDVVRRAIEHHRPKVLALHHASNVTGVVQPVAAISELARERGVLTVVDAAQSAPHLALDVERLGADFLAFSGHKLLGPKGLGVLYGRPELLARLDPLCVGGGAVQTVRRDGFVLRPPPEGLEAGTPNVAGAVGLAAATDYLDSIGRDAVEAHGHALGALLRDVTAKLPVARVLAATEGESIPIVSLVLRSGGIGADQLAVALSDTFGIMVRSGLQCAHPLFAELEASDGAVRASAYLYNDEHDVHAFADACGALLRRLGG
jgi:cysteine desulfurase / selenocysteine lyase